MTPREWLTPAPTRAIFARCYCPGGKGLPGTACDRCGRKLGGVAVEGYRILSYLSNGTLWSQAQARRSTRKQAEAFAAKHAGRTVHRCEIVRIVAE